MLHPAKDIIAQIEAAQKMFKRHRALVDRLYTLIQTIEKNIKLMQKPDNTNLEQETALFTQERDNLKDFLFNNRSVAEEQIQNLQK